jgi:hypothetical protein
LYTKCSSQPTINLQLADRRPDRKRSCIFVSCNTSATHATRTQNRGLLFCHRIGDRGTSQRGRPAGDQILVPGGGIPESSGLVGAPRLWGLSRAAGATCKAMQLGIVIPTRGVLRLVFSCSFGMHPCFEPWVWVGCAVAAFVGTPQRRDSESVSPTSPEYTLSSPTNTRTPTTCISVGQSHLACHVECADRPRGLSRPCKTWKEPTNKVA